MARIVIAANSSWNIENFRAGIVRELVRDGHEVITVSPDAAGPSIEEAQVPHRIWKLHRSSMNPLKDVSYAIGLCRILAQERPDIFLGFTIKPNLYGCGACKLLKIPAVPNVSGLGTAFLGSRMLTRAVLLLYRLAFASAKTVFFQNPDDRHLFTRAGVVKPGQSRILPGSGIDLARFCPSELPTGLSFLMIARLLGDKGVREYVRAARKLKSTLPDARFALLGELDPHNRTAIRKSELQDWIRAGDIEYLGSTSDVRPFIRESSAVVLPSYREGLPRTLLEAAAMGRPLIGTDVAGCREVVRDGTTGFLCEARSADSLADSIERFASSSYEDRARMGRNARAMAEEEFDERLVIGAYLEVIRKLTVSRKGAALNPS